MSLVEKLLLQLFRQNCMVTSFLMTIGHFLHFVPSRKWTFLLLLAHFGKEELWQPCSRISATWSTAEQPDGLSALAGLGQLLSNHIGLLFVLLALLVVRLSFLYSSTRIHR